MRFTRFTAVGVLCAVLSNVAVIALVRHGFGPLLASVLAFGPVLVIGYALHSAFTFGTQPSRVTFVRYTLATLTNFLVWAALLFLFGDLLNVSITLLAPAATLLMFLWNYLASSWAFVPQPFGRRPS